MVGRVLATEIAKRKKIERTLEAGTHLLTRVAGKAVHKNKQSNILIGSGLTNPGIYAGGYTRKSTMGFSPDNYLIYNSFCL